MNPLSLLDAYSKHPNSIYTVNNILGEDQISYRLREIGLLNGQKIKINGRAPFLGPYFLYFMNSFWALRDEELARIIVSIQEGV